MTNDETASHARPDKEPRQYMPPEIVDDKSRIGDWEIDTVIGKGHSGALVTIVELVTKYTVSAKVNSKSAADVTKATISLLNPFKDTAHNTTQTLRFSQQPKSSNFS